MYEKLYLVSAAQLEKINESKTPAINYTDLYNSVIKTQSEQAPEPAPIKIKLKVREWLTLYHGEDIET